MAAERSQAACQSARAGTPTRNSWLANKPEFLTPGIAVESMDCTRPASRARAAITVGSSRAA